MVRDPRDVLVSSYYSFGFTHRLSRVDEIRETQQKFRDEIQTTNIDDYVLNHSEQIEDGYRRVAALREACPRHIVLRYEDMIDDWQTFADGLTTYVDLKPSVLDELYRLSRPKPTEDSTSHHRSGKTGDFERKLSARTIVQLNARLAGILRDYAYPDTAPQEEETADGPYSTA
jgi:hypothetical protein